ncbi:hypothetical protein DICPUDRAFT_33526 [Dictyostelium purpureum]|uniref:Uncharacterized protein n=1 Tax=Dictyostelium purpureum TaxID=5786 RepID=F0ZL29_DICPU|nr:uncharacterized protein DICPUDRAFT_33526 [Dictyostelium purpureum]EGC35368.1 hypothetical protein DICPUDRAFT_33526 [Dictyostelium purpureum]|eukprot:XP_003288106.1 hypothetical protein DICPUDRAFT_33526 [Dictyostelium purpureum]
MTTPNPILHKYRFLIRNLPNYPSKSRFRLITTVKEEKLKMLHIEVDSGITEIMGYKNLRGKGKNGAGNF